MCRFGRLGLRRCFYNGFGPREAAFRPRPDWRRAQVEEEIHYTEEYKRDLEQELAEVTARLKTLKNQD